MMERNLEISRRKVNLKPNHSLLDWQAKLLERKVFAFHSKNSRQTRIFGKFTRQQVALHSQSDDCWCILHGKVYDLTDFADYHPGGHDLIRNNAGRDISFLFSKQMVTADKYHSWVNYEALLAGYEIGFVIG
jgi:cytochrome b involved in lipid metabolism